MFGNCGPNGSVWPEKQLHGVVELTFGQMLMLMLVDRSDFGPTKVLFDSAWNCPNDACFLDL